MNFGQDESFHRIEILIRDGREEDYTSFCNEILYVDLKILVNKYFYGWTKEDKEDAVSISAFKVIRGLTSFWKNSAYKSEAERNAFLSTIVQNVRNDMLRKRIPKEEVERQLVEGSSEQKTYEKDISEKMVLQEEVFQILKIVFELDTSPEKMLAFIYNKVFGAISGGNGKPQDIAAEFNGVPLRIMYEQMLILLQDYLENNIPKKVLRPIEKKIAEYGEREFYMTPRNITDSSNWICNKLRGK